MHNDPENSQGFKPDPYYSDQHATFGDRLCAAREESGISQKMLASRLGVKVRTIQAWEGDASEPRANKLQMVSALLNVSMVWLMSGLGAGIKPPNENDKNPQTELIQVLNELRNVRLVNDIFLKKLTELENKIINNLQ